MERVRGTGYEVRGSSRLAVLALLAALAAGPAAAQVALTDVSCAAPASSLDRAPAPTRPTGHLAWPAGDPVWELDVYRPANRTTVNGAGLELRDVRYRGRKVLDRAGVPVLNVEYDPGAGCGCFRDWQFDEAPIDLGSAAAASSCFALAAPGDVRTACEANAALRPEEQGRDVGAFEGITVEDYGTELVLTSHAEAGWYRYRMKWHLYADGRIWPEFSFAAVEGVCTQSDHRHHAYWRFDFDLEGTPADDVVREHRDGAVQTFTTEAARRAAAGAFWSVTDGRTGAGYEVVPGEADLRLPADAFSKTDALVLRYKLDEIDDGLTVQTGCAFAFEPFVDGEPLGGADVVFWYRSGALHIGGDPYQCDVIGPTLRPVGWAPGPGTVGVEVEAARPNPFTGTATVRFRVVESQDVAVVLYDALGRRVRALWSGRAEAGRYETVRVEGRGLPAGAYVVRLVGETARGSARVVLVR